MIENDEQIKKQILNSVLETIRGISDKEYQKRVWIRGEGPEVDDFVETCCHFFDDGDPILENYQEYNVSENQYSILVKLRNVFWDFSNNHDFPEEFIDSPEWNEIVEMAKKVLIAFGYEEGKNFSP